MRARIAQMAGGTLTSVLVAAACAKPAGPTVNRKPADVPLFSVIYADSDGKCTMAASPAEAVRAKVGDTVSFQVLNLCKEEYDVSLEVTADGDPFSEKPNKEYTLNKVTPGARDQKKLTVLKQANETRETRGFKFNLKFNDITKDPRLEVDP